MTHQSPTCPWRGHCCLRYILRLHKCCRWWMMNHNGILVRRWFIQLANVYSRTEWNRLKMWCYSMYRSDVCSFFPTEDCNLLFIMQTKPASSMHTKTRCKLHWLFSVGSQLAHIQSFQEMRYWFKVLSLNGEWALCHEAWQCRWIPQWSWETGDES